MISITSLTSTAALGDNDPNGDGVINVADAVYINQYLYGYYNPTDESEVDFDESGVITPMDSLKVYAYDAGVLRGSSSEEVVYPRSCGSDSVSYRIYSAITGNAISGNAAQCALNPSLESDYTLTVPSNRSLPTRTNDDPRVVDWTKRPICKIMTSDNNSYLGTGFAVDDHTIATAAHCVCDPANGRGKAIGDIKFFSANGTESFDAEAIEIHVPAIYADEGHLSAWDYALITISENLDNYYVPYLRLGVALEEAATNNVQVTVHGFPSIVNNGFVNTGSIHTAYSDTGEITNVTSRYIYADAYTSSGNSGSPIYVSETALGTTYYTAVGVWTNSGFGQRFTPEHLRFYLDNDYLLY